MGKLTDTKIKSAKAKSSAYTLSDGLGLSLHITPKKQKWWRFRYQFNGKSKMISLGTYPDTGLATAREKLLEARKKVASGFDPSTERKKEKIIRHKTEAKKDNTFYNVSQKWLKSYVSEVSENYHLKLSKALENYTYKKYTLEDSTTLCIKNKPIDEILRIDILNIIKALKNKGLDETARRTLSIINRVYKYAVTYEYAPRNIITDIDTKIALGKKKENNYPTLTKKKDIKGLLISIDDFNGGYPTKMALKVLPYLFVRSYNIRHMEWKEINFKDKIWTIPKDKMKMKEEFILPLPHQVIEILEEVKENALGTKYVFPSPMYKDRPLSDNALISALRRMGYKSGELVPHSFRSIFSTIANEEIKPSNVIEALLAHTNPNKTEKAYNRAEYTEPKRELIQWYADFLEGTKASK